MPTAAPGKPNTVKPTSALPCSTGAPEVLPWWLLRRLCVAHEVSIGSRVLVVGCGDGSILQQLEWLGIDVAGTDESAENVAEARRKVQAAEVARFFGTGRLPFASGTFDAVLVRPQAVARRNLLSAGSLESSAQLLSCLRPGGWFVCLSRSSSDGNRNQSEPAEPTGTDHSEACYRQHLQPFPGTFRSQSVYFGFPWDRLLPRRSRAPFQTSALHVPSQAMSREQWLQYARQAEESAAASCCAAGADAKLLDSSRRAA